MKHVKQAKCPICTKDHTKEFEFAALYLQSWIEFPNLQTLEGGVVKALCGDKECLRQSNMNVGVRFQCWTPGGRR